MTGIKKTIIEKFFKGVFFVMVLLGVGSGCGVKKLNTNSQPVTHEKWTALLQKHVKPSGLVDYQGFVDDKKELEAYLELLESNHPNDENWSEEERLAYWMNVYNAFTIKLVVDHYPTKSIKDIKKGITFVNSVWDIKFIKIQGATYDLNNIEHSILRKRFDEPRIHFAINCASISCPNLRDEAFVPGRLEEQLTEQARLFLSDESKNKIAKDKVELSKIFSWFGGDFKKETTLIQYLNKYSPVPIDDNAEKSFLDYDWNLNDVPKG